MIAPPASGRDDGDAVIPRQIQETDVQVGIGKTGYERLHEVQRQMYEALKPFLLEVRMRVAGESRVA